MQIRTEPYAVGEIARLGAPSRDAMCTVRSPSGQVFTLPGARGWAEVWALDEGTWTYSWDTGHTGSFDAIRKQPEIVLTDFVAVPAVDVRCSQAVLVEIQCNARHGGPRMTNRLVEGSTMLLSVRFRHPTTKQLVDPDAIEVTLVPPSGDARAIQAVRNDDGSYSCSSSVESSGRWLYVIESKGNYPNRSEGSFDVEPSRVA
jgi:hypothetical protein